MNNPRSEFELETGIRRHFLDQAEACDRMGSPFTATLCRILSARLDRSSKAGRKVLSWPGNPTADALALRMCGGLHRLVLAGADSALAAVYPPAPLDPQVLDRAVVAAISQNDDFLSEALNSPPQTNEIARSAMLYPGILTIARETELPLALHEIGSSAGLNLLFDAFRYEYGGVTLGSTASPVALVPEVRGKPIPLEGHPQIASRVGSDIAPVDISDPAARLGLRSFVWADQTARMQRLDGALALAKSRPYVVENANAEDFVERKLAARDLNSVFVLFYSIMWQYVPQGQRDKIEAMLSAAGLHASTNAPIAWLRMEPADMTAGYAMLSLTLWPNGTTRHLARCDFHGRWIEWLC